MRQKIGYFLLGAFVATVGYIVGDMDFLDAADDITRVKNLVVEERLLIGDTDTKYTSITATNLYMKSGLFNHIFLSAEPFETEFVPLKIHLAVDDQFNSVILLSDKSGEKIIVTDD